MGKISYINASPVFYGLDNGLLPEWLEMISKPPADLNRMIISNDIVISPISAAFYAMNHRDLLVLPDFSISCHGNVMSVILMSKYPLEGLDEKNIVLTEESATAASLIKMIFSKQNVNPNLEIRSIKSIDDVKDNVDGALIIGDAALTQPWESLFKYRIDLGDLWFKLTKLPFVFAIWVVRRSFAENEPQIVKNVIKLLNKSRGNGYDNIGKIIESGAKKLNLKQSFIKEYYNHLYCDFDLEKIKALEMFFKFLYEERILKEKVEVELFS
ncbi:MAG: menaquinone biosynthesis protein [Desulfobacteraceae bacterium]|nr:menaquinone biosynthesis protein [Desulfobacteraceae bacterium]